MLAFYSLLALLAILNQVWIYMMESVAPDQFKCSEEDRTAWLFCNCDAVEPVFGVHSLILILTALFPRTVFVSTNQKPKCCCGDVKLIFADLKDLCWQSRNARATPGDLSLTNKMEIGLERKLQTELRIVNVSEQKQPSKPDEIVDTEGHLV